MMGSKRLRGGSDEGRVLRGYSIIHVGVGIIYEGKRPRCDGVPCGRKGRIPQREDEAGGDHKGATTTGVETYETEGRQESDLAVEESTVWAENITEAMAGTLRRDNGRDGVQGSTMTQ